MHVSFRIFLIVGALLATSGSVSSPVAVAQQPIPPTPPPVVPLRLPAEIKATLNVPVLVEAQSAGKLHRWRADGGLVVVPPNGNTSKVWVVPVVKARIRLVCTTVTDTEFVDAETVVVVDDAQPGPGPVPPPNPFPIPPNPTPPPPNPTPPAPPIDPLFGKLLASFLDDPLPAALKKVQLRSLGAVYEAAAQLAGDQSITTAADLLKRIKSVSDITVAPGSLTTLRKLLVAELQAALGDEPTATLTPEQRARAVALFIRIAGLLSKLG